MSSFVRLADFCWDGLTLKHITERKIIFPYILFLVMAGLLELYLAVLLIFTGFLYYTYSLFPSLLFYICTGIILSCLTLTCSLFAVVCRHDYLKFTD
jgi:hypothetical protein